MRVEVYFNLHRKCWSIRDLKTRRVIHHAQAAALTNCTMHVSAAGRARVLREKRKNVHAFIRGNLVMYDVNGGDPRLDMEHYIKYNPFKFETFVDGNSLEPVHKAAIVHFNGKTVTYRG